MAAARHLQRGAGNAGYALRGTASPRRVAPASLDAPWISPEQRDVLAYMGQRRREAEQLVQSSADHSGRVAHIASRNRPWHDPSCGLQMALPKLKALSAKVTIDDIVVDQMERERVRVATAEARLAAAIERDRELPVGGAYAHDGVPRD